MRTNDAKDRLRRRMIFCDAWRGESRISSKLIACQKWYIKNIHTNLQTVLFKISICVCSLM